MHEARLHPPAASKCGSTQAQHAGVNRKQLPQLRVCRESVSWGLHSAPSQCSDLSRTACSVLDCSFADHLHSTVCKAYAEGRLHTTRRSAHLGSLCFELLRPDGLMDHVGVGCQVSPHLCAHKGHKDCVAGWCLCNQVPAKSRRVNKKMCRMSCVVQLVPMKATKLVLLAGASAIRYLHSTRASEWVLVSADALQWL